MKKLIKQVLDWCGLGMGWVWDGYDDLSLLFFSCVSNSMN